jgi:hypothetical protein
VDTTATTASAGRLMLTVLSGIAEFERNVILQRTNEVRHGRGHEVWPQAEADQAPEIALSYNVDHSTIGRLKARYAAAV